MSIIDLDDWPEQRPPAKCQEEASTPNQNPSSDGSSDAIDSDVSKTDKHHDNYDDPHDEHMFEFSKDTYSFVFFSKVFSRSFFYGLFIFLLQVSVLILSLIDLLKQSSKENWFYVPPYVDWWVFMSQILALIISVFTIDDLLYSITAMGLVGYRSELKKQFPGATRIKWYLSHVLRGIMGIMILVVSFLIVVQGDVVLDIFKDFAAIHLVGEIDGVAFQVARSGFFGPSLRYQAIRMEDVKVTESKKQKHWLYFIYIGSTLTLVAFMMAMLVYIHHLQERGVYVYNSACWQVQVSFGSVYYSIPANIALDPDLRSNSSYKIADSFNLSDPPEIHYSYFSGLYVVEEIEYSKLKFPDHRPIYFERDYNNKTAGYFYFCKSITAWVFTVKALLPAIPEEIQNDCEDGWLLRSPKADVFSLDQVPKDGWIAWTGKLQYDVTIDLSCLDCTENADCGVRNGKCTPEKRSCECYEGYIGSQCNEKKPCNTLSREFEGIYDVNASYHLLRNSSGSEILVYDRPCYLEGSESVMDYSDCPDTLLEFIFYSGSRWYDAFVNCSTIQQLVEDEASFHTYWGNALHDHVRWYSEPTTNFLPIGTIEWYELGASKAVGNFGAHRYSFPIRQRFDCLAVDCNVNDICGLGAVGNKRHGGTCDPTYPWSFPGSGLPVEYGTCDCYPSFEGHYCELEVSS